MSEKLQTIGYRKEDVEGTDPITSGSPAYYEFGHYSKSWGNFPVMKLDIMAKRYGGSNYASSHSIYRKLVQGVVTTLPVNAQAFYHLFPVVTHNAGVFSLSPVASGSNLDTYTIREYLGATSTVKKSNVACKFNSISWVHDFNEPGFPVSVTEGFLGKNKQAINSGSEAATPSFPSSEEEEYSKATYGGDSFSLIWDQGGDNHDISSDIMNITTVIDNNITPIPLLNQQEMGYLRTGTYNFGVTMLLERTSDTNVFDDYLLQIPADSFKNMRYKVFNKASQYIQLDYTDFTIEKITYNNNLGEDPPHYEILAIPRLISPTVKDGLATTFYGV